MPEAHHTKATASLGTPVPGEAAPSISRESALSDSHHPDPFERAASSEPIPSASPLGTAAALDDHPIIGSHNAAGAKLRLGDRLFRGLTSGAGIVVIALIGLIAVFLLAEAIPSIMDDQDNFLTSRNWEVGSDALRFGIVDLFWTTVIGSIAAMIIAVPIAIGIALFITQYAPPRLARPVAFVIDLLAAIPSIVYGLWGLLVLGPALEPVCRFLADILGWFPLFKETSIAFRGSLFIAAVVLAIMILPIITAVAREVFERTPRTNIEAAWALGATRWEMIRMSVLPHGKAGVVSGAMLGLGRALGETIAIALILGVPGQGNPFNPSLFYGGETFASKIALASAEFANPRQTGAYIAAGLVLFALTFAVNAAARVVINRRKEFS